VCLTFSKKLTGSQLSLPHGTNKKLKCKTKNKKINVTRNTCNITRNRCNITGNTCNTTRNTCNSTENTCNITRNTCNVTRNTCNITRLYQQCTNRQKQSNNKNDHWCTNRHMSTQSPSNTQSLLSSSIQLVAFQGVRRKPCTLSPFGGNF